MLTPNTLTPNKIKQCLAGQSFTVMDASVEVPIRFDFPDHFEGWPRRGGEGLVVPVVCRHPEKGDIPSILKIFNQALPIRAERQSHLEGFDLPDLHARRYAGVPYIWVDTEVAGHRIYGSVAKHICDGQSGDDFQIVRSESAMDDLTEENRRAMARRLCATVLGLEGLEIVHGDLSPANVVIEKCSDDDVDSVLIDYDGFHSPDVPMLPRRHDGKELRKLGSHGYQHPSLMRRIRPDNRNDESLFVENDRFALGVLCFELMTFTSHIWRNLEGREHLLNLDALERGCLDVPEAVKPQWPEGLKLLEESVNEPDANSLPEPYDWILALGFEGTHWSGLRKDWTSTPFVKVFQQHGNRAPTRVKRAHFAGLSESGDFQKMVDPLSWISYNYEHVNGCCVRCAINVHSSALVLMKRDGVTKQLGVNPGEIEIHPGDRVLVDGWALEFQDASLGTNW